jgi:hypothetical protein
MSTRPLGISRTLFGRVGSIDPPDRGRTIEATPHSQRLSSGPSTMANRATSCGELFGTSAARCSTSSYSRFQCSHDTVAAVHGRGRSVHRRSTSERGAWRPKSPRTLELCTRVSDASTSGVSSGAVTCRPQVGSQRFCRKSAACAGFCFKNGRQRSSPSRKTLRNESPNRPTVPD